YYHSPYGTLIKTFCFLYAFFCAFTFNSSPHPARDSSTVAGVALRRQNQVSINSTSPKGSDSPILNPYPVMSLEAVSEVQEI
ncbi:hypothetical protein, partial [Umezakia ovalisporum]|uniref:hypothetical protein n=1 Tax=Umezakia ovalisporum TaxID=75695 RepID=UPI0035B6B94D